LTFPPRIRELLETDYANAPSSTPATASGSSPHTIRLTRSWLDADFDDEEEDMDELEQYLSDKPANKEMDVLVWWKVNATYYLRLVYWNI